MHDKEETKRFYDNWAIKQLEDSDREATLKWKAVNMANLIFRQLKNERINYICEISGAEGIVINTLGSLVKAKNKRNYELSEEFCKIGEHLYSDIEFINAEFGKDSDKNGESSSIYDMIILSDITEHVIDDSSFLAEVAKSCKYVVLKMPIERCLISHNLAFLVLGRKVPLDRQFGYKHHNGHLRGYTIKSALNTVSESFDVLDYKVSDVTYFYPSKRASLVKMLFGERMTTYVFGGALFVLAEAK
ncbi:MAG: hypothetical protein JKY51_02390 [Opitutaceae bacterium]|nr:hypothetical protein [Opitutaceae bacterium]